MHAQLRRGLGILILVLTAGSAVTIGILLPINSVNLMSVIKDDLIDYGLIGENDIVPNDGTGNYSEWMYTGPFTNESLFYERTRIEFFNISDREGYLDYSTAFSYYYVQGALYFDLTINKTIKEYDAENDYIVYAYKKQYVFNEEVSTLDPDAIVYNSNYMWPYYIKHFGNGTEYGFQAYVAALLLQNELNTFQDDYGYTDNELACAVLNRTYAENANGQNLVDLSSYLPHNWLSVRPAYSDINLDLATSYKILFNATYNGHDYSVLTGETGSAKYFLDLVKGLDYTESDDLIVDVDQLLADIYDIDTPTEKESAQSFAAYLTYLLGKPSLDWLFENKISYVCARTAMEWVQGIEDPLLGNNKFPLLKNDTLSASGLNWDSDLYYAEQLGVNNKDDLGKIIALANIPYYENARSMEILVEGDFAYVLEGGTDVKVVNMTHPLFLAIGQYGDYSGIVNSFSVINSFIYAVEGTRGLEVLDAQFAPESFGEIIELQQWTNGLETDFRDIDSIRAGTGENLVIANGEYGLLYTRLDLDYYVGSSEDFVTSGDALVIDAYADPFDPSISIAYVGLGTDGIDIIDVNNPASMVLENHYDSTDFPKLTNVIDLKRDGNYLYVLDQTEGLLIFQTFSNNTLIELGQYPFNPLETPYLDLDISSSNAFLAQGDYGVTVVDISNKNNPSELYRFNSTEHKGSAFGVSVEGNNIYLADYGEGLVHFEFIQTPLPVFNFVEKDELHTFMECWNQFSKVQFNRWTLTWQISGEQQWFNETFDSFAIPPFSEQSYRNQWLESFMKPFVYSSFTESAIYVDKDVLSFNAQYQTPYLQLDTNPLYWMTVANYVNQSFIHAGYWNQLYDLGILATDLDMGHSLPGRLSDSIHEQNMLAEPITGSVVYRADRVQYDTKVQQFIEAYSLLNTTKYGTNVNQLTAHLYNTWHTTNPVLAGGFGNIFWQEDVHHATDNFYNFLTTNYLDRIDSADTSRTIGAFGSMFIISVGIVVTSVVLHRTKPKTKDL